ncbi:GNAT family N-acetyltransferase [Bacillus sp. 165]|uniref:GNAT family N-acetyltransferase n=1 Tax=Bacillus sp. 165 TaxID=1529117 RepID=UPI001AD956E0|nr:GNAT family N-acetyltransferase [Bacillus sp. 165]MBO9128949.1 GNAT family N-acetyltransferase [Bacillus sp. 165]
MITLTSYTNVMKFKQDVIPFLERHEGENNLPLGVLAGLAEDAEPQFMATFVKNGELVLVLLQTHPRQMIAAKPEYLTKEEIREIAELLHKTYPQVPGIVGETSFITELAPHLSHMQGRKHYVHINQGIYVLTKIKKAAEMTGILRKADDTDIVLATDWIYAFATEIGEPMEKEEADKRATDMIEKGRLYLWEVDGTPVSMAAATRPTKHNITVSYVYTPVAERKKGHASNCVAALTQVLLDAGYQTTSLYTDLANPTSNKIYMEIGYEFVMNSVLILMK